MKYNVSGSSKLVICLLPTYRIHIKRKKQCRLKFHASAILGVSSILPGEVEYSVCSVVLGVSM